MRTSQVSRFIHRLRRGGGTTDGQLLRCFAEGRDEEAFEALVRRHGPMVLALCRRVLGNVHDAEDAFQATFLVLARKAASLRQPELLGNWLYGVAYRVAREARAKAWRHRARERQVKEMPQPAAEPEDAWQDWQDLLDRELSALPDKYRAPVVLCELEGLPRKEVARRLKVPEGTLSSRLATARRMLARQLARRGLALPGAALAAALAQSASACVPPPLVSSTAQAAVLVAVGGGTASAVPAKVAALTEGALRSMFLSKLRVATTVLLVAGALAGAGLLGRGVRRAEEGGGEGGALPAFTAPAFAAPAPEAPPAPPRPGSDRAVWKTVESDGSAWAVAFSPDGSAVASTGEDGLVRLWDARTGASRPPLPGRGSVTPRCLAFSPDGRLLAVGGARAVHLWDARNAKLVRTLPGHVDEVMGIAFSRDGRLLASSSYKLHSGKWVGGDVKLWDVRSGKLEWTRKASDEGPSSVAFAPDGKTLASAEGVVRLRDVRTGAVKQTFKPERGEVLYVAFSPDRKTLAGGGGYSVPAGCGGTRMVSEVRLWDVRSGKLKRTLKDLHPWLRSLAFSPDGKTLATGSSGPIRKSRALTWVSSETRLWDARTGELRRTVGGTLGHTWSIAFSPDGGAALTCDEAEVVLTDTRTGARRATLLTVKGRTPHPPGPE